MKKITAFARRNSVALVAGVTALVASAPAWATDPTVDYTSGVAAGKTELIGAINGILPAVLPILAILCGIGMLWRMFKRASKSA